MASIFNDYRDFKPGELVEMNPFHLQRFRTTELGGLGIVTGHNKQGWIKVTWSDGSKGTWPFYKLAKANK